MRFPWLVLACVLATPVFPTAHAQGAAPLTLADAVRLAQAANPAVRAREAQLAAAEGTRREARALLFNNPELAAEGTRRRFVSPDGSAHEWNAGIAQVFETGGQQAHRRDAAEAALEALQAEIDDARRQAGAAAALRHGAVLAAKRREQIEQRGVELFDSTAQAIDQRRAAGEDTRLDANVARIEAERARNAHGVARERLLDARAELAVVLQLPAPALPEVAGTLDPPAALRYDLQRLLDSMAAQPRLRALGGREDAARARLAVERAARYPDLKLGLFAGREGAGNARENLATLALSLPLPLFKQNDAAIGQASSDAAQAQIDRAAVVRDTEAQVRRLWLRLGSQRERVERLQRTMAAAAADNRQLAAKSRQAGQIGLLDQLLVDRQTIDAEREFNDALAEYHATRIELETAAGWPLEGSAP
ncbi:MAG: TolC family protein [Rubrivivax sp.]